MLHIGAPLVGRDPVLRDIEAALRTARDGHGGLVLLTGGPGIGKSRLAEEVAMRARDFNIAWVWCGLDAEAQPFRPWRQLVRTLAGGDERLRQMVREYPSLAALVSGEAGDQAGDPEASRTLLFEDLSEFLREAASSKPLLAVFDDLHDAQESSLQLLAYLAAGVHANRVLLLATARESEPEWHGHTAARASVRQQAHGLHLSPLNELDVRRLVASLTGPNQPSGVAESVMARTGGNPLLVIELARHLERHSSERVPDSVVAMAKERMDRLGASARGAVEAAAVLGVRFGVNILAQMLGVDSTDATDLLSGGEAARLIVPEPTARWRFVHELLQEAVYQRLPAGERARLHERASAAVLQEDAANVSAAAFHLLLAGPQHAPAAAELAWQAGNQALAAMAYEDAARWYEQAKTALDRSGSTAERRAELLLALAEARQGSGDRAGAREELLRAAALARETGQVALLARAALGLGFGPAGFEVALLDREQIDVLEEARARLSPAEPSLQALVTARLSVAVTMLESEDRRLALAEEAVESAHASGDKRALVYALSALCDAQAGPDYCAARRSHAEEMIASAIGLRDRPLELLGRRLRLVALLETGDISQADAEIAAYAACAQALRHPLYSWYVPLWRGMRALMGNELEKCRAWCDEVERLGSAAGSHNAYLLAATQRWCLSDELGDRAVIMELIKMLEELDMLEGLDLSGAWVTIVRALMKAQLGNLDEAQRLLDSVAPHLRELPKDSEWLPCLAQVAEIVDRLGNHPCAAWAYEAQLPYAGLFVIEGIGAANRGPVQLHLALLARALGRFEDAARHFRSALEACRTIGASQLAARVEREMAAGHDARLPAGGAVFRREGELWTVRFGGRESRLRHSKGVSDIATLLSRPSTHVAALDLVTSIGPGRPNQQKLSPAGDTGEVLDATAREAYRERLVELEHEAAEADLAGDSERSAIIAEERDALVDQLTQAYGLGGRHRRTGSAAERARVTVTARIHEAIRRIERVHPELGRHLAHSIRTGTFCSYEPESPVDWQM